MWSEFEAPCYGNIDELERVQKQTEREGGKRHQRGRITHGGRLRNPRAGGISGRSRWRAGMDIWELAGSSTSAETH